MEHSKFIVSIDRQTWEFVLAFYLFKPQFFILLRPVQHSTYLLWRFLPPLNTSARPRPLHNHIARTSLRPGWNKKSGSHTRVAFKIRGTWFQSSEYYRLKLILDPVKPWRAMSPWCLSPFFLCSLTRGIVFISRTVAGTWVNHFPKGPVRILLWLD